MFIVIEWIDGSWKWTQVQIINEKLINMWKKVLILDYPRYWNESAFMVKKYLNWEYWNTLSAKQASIFYAIDRFDELNSLKNNFIEYDYIISNRYVSANMIHQWWKINDENIRNEFLEWIDELEYNIFWIPREDKTIFLNISIEKSQELILKKNSRDYIKWWKKVDLHEKDLLHLENARNTALYLIKKYPNWVQIDCEKDWNLQSIDDINTLIMNEILK